MAKRNRTEMDLLSCYSSLSGTVLIKKTSRPSMAAHISCTVLHYPFLMSHSEASHSHFAVQYEIDISYVLQKLAL